MVEWIAVLKAAEAIVPKMKDRPDFSSRRPPLAGGHHGLSDQ